MSLITSQEALRADEIADELQGLGQWARWRVAPRPARKPRWQVRAEQQRESVEEKRQRLLREAAEHGAKATVLRQQALAEFERAKRAKILERQLMTKANWEQALASKYQRQADALAPKAVATSV
jgi:hypothetical protein